MILRVEPNKETVLIRDIDKKTSYTVAIIVNDKSALPLDIQLYKCGDNLVARFDTFFGYQEILFNYFKGGKLLK